VLALGCPPLSCEYLYRDGDTRPEKGPPQNPGELGYCLSVRREQLDYILVRRAAQTKEVTFAERTQVTGLLREGQRVVGVRLATSEGEAAVRARIIIGADGRHSYLARAVEAGVELSNPPTRALYYTYVRDLPGPNGGAADGPEFSFAGDEIAYTFPSDQGLTCVALSVNLETFRWLKQSAAERFWERLARHRGIANRLDGAKPEGGLLACGPELNVVRTPVGPGWALVGDAGLHQDPWTGRGMDMAGMHAVQLAEALTGWLGGERPEREALGEYHCRRNETGVEVYRQTVDLARDLRQV
jgi:2-polyprenyl-6-methoxyphenol hydroxylase-like FAD-dependent oxidoreductase